MIAVTATPRPGVGLPSSSSIRRTVAAVITRDGVRRTRPPGCDDADMRAMTVVPGQKETAGVEEVPDPDAHDAALLVRGMTLGVCGQRTST